jgi:hypothetical protein
MVSCNFGSIAGGSAATVTISATTTAVGAGLFEASVTANDDDNESNNAATALVTVDPAVELIANQPAMPTVTVNQGATIAVMLENQSSLDSTNVTLGVALGAGIRADSASWPIGSCTISGQQVSCEAARFDGLSSSTLSLGLTGLTAGTSTYTVTLESTEADADPANNDVSGSVRINAVNVANEESGGGALSWLLLGAMGAAARRRKLRKT